jgi:hypothetical protein
METIKIYVQKIVHNTRKFKIYFILDYIVNMQNGGDINDH